jgi:hypothetical protein
MVNPESDRPARELEVGITPEMRDAGSLAYFASDRRIEPMEEIVERVFLAMLAARESAV